MSVVTAVAQLRARLRLRQRLRPSGAVKGDEELAWWLGHWDPVLVDGGFLPDDVLLFLPGEERAATYEGRRQQQARAEVRRVLREAGIEDPTFFHNKVVVDIGPGALGFPDACPARISIGVEPLAQRFADAGLLLASDAVYLAARAEAIPLVSGTVDVVLARNSLDHVDDPRAAVAAPARPRRARGGARRHPALGHARRLAPPRAAGSREDGMRRPCALALAFLARVVAASGARARARKRRAGAARRTGRAPRRGGCRRGRRGRRGARRC
jgi:hypothetical protein